MRHLIVLSDLHLWQATDHQDLWMRYRHRRFLPDGEVAELLSLLRKQIPDGDLELCLNGDIFDFDVPPVVDGHAQPALSPRSEDAAADRLLHILSDHELFLDTLASLLLSGNRLVFLAGNHDVQLNFPRVQALLLERLFIICQRSRPSYSFDALTAQVTFSAWYHQTPFGVHIEHGNQYDPYCSIPDPQWPFRSDKTLQTNVGTLTIEHLIGQMGYFNPNVESSFLLTTREYIEHWRRYYFGTPRSLVGTWLFGSLRIVWGMLKAYGLHSPVQRAAELQSAEEAAHTTLFALADLRATMRLLHLDRAILLLFTLLTAMLFLVWAPLGVVMALVTLGVRSTLRPASHKQPQAQTTNSLDKQEALAAVNAQVARSARLIARVYGARAVIFGHTHQAEGRWEDGVFYGNSGTWVPMYKDPACSIPVEQSRPFIWLRHDDGQLSGGLYRFHDGQLHPPTETSLPEPPTPVEAPAPPKLRRRLALPPMELATR